jgi:hypothetical protein
MRAWIRFYTSIEMDGAEPQSARRLRPGDGNLVAGWRHHAQPDPPDAPAVRQLV